MTWKEIKLATLQKMFAADGENIPTDETTTDYLAGMPQVANEAIRQLATAGKYSLKKIEIAHNPVENILQKGKMIYSAESGDIEFEGVGARSYYAEFYGVGTLKIYVNSVLITTVSLSSSQNYAAYKGLIENASGLSVKIVFNSDYPFAVKNIALYKANFQNANSVQPFSEKIRHKLSDLVNDFYQIDTQEVYFEGSQDTKTYSQTNSYFLEGNNVLVLDRDIPGNYTVYYRAYPDVITLTTVDEYVLGLDPEVAVILPLYMASQLYKDDDAGIATSYRNEFEVAFDRLSKGVKTPVAEKFESKGGWY